MSAYLYAAVGLAVLAVIAYPVLTYLIDKPEGGHHRPPWWRRWREERAQERAQDALNVRLIHDIHEGIKRESTGRTSSGMPRADWPLQPLPEGAEEYADHFHRPFVAAEGWREETIVDGPFTVEDEPPPPAVFDAYDLAAIGMYEEDPQDVATPGQVADELVGLAGQPGENGSDEAGLIGPQGAESLPSPAPEPEPSAVDTPLADYREETGSWAAIRDDVLAGGE